MPTPTQFPLATSPTWDEMIDSDSGEVNHNAPTSQRRWSVTGCYDVNLLITTAPANIPRFNVRGGITQFFKSYKYDPTSPTKGDSWVVTASYSFEAEYFELSFDTSGATYKRFQALDEGTYYACASPGGEVTPGDPVSPGSTVTIPDFKGLVGVNESNIAGVDVPDEKFDFTVLIRNKFSTLPALYIDALRTLTGHANENPLTIRWKGQEFPFAAEELVFLGAPGKITSEDGFELTLKFSAQKGTPASTLVAGTGYFQPPVGQSVAVTVDSTTGFTANSKIYITNGGLYLVLTVIGADTLSVRNLGAAGNVAPGVLVDEGELVTNDGTRRPLVIGESGAIQKLGQRYVWTRAQYRLIGGRNILQPQYAIVNKVIPTADLTAIGIFT